MKPPNKDLKALQAEWDAKLKKSGFDDKETRDGQLKHWSSRYFSSTMNGAYPDEKIAYNKAKEEYYRLAGFFLHDYKFATNKERFIWQLHAEGVGMREIAITLKRKHFKKTDKMKICQIIQRLAKIMKKGIADAKE